MIPIRDNRQDRYVPIVTWTLIALNCILFLWDREGRIFGSNVVFADLAMRPQEVVRAVQDLEIRRWSDVDREDFREAVVRVRAAALVAATIAMSVPVACGGSGGGGTAEGEQATVKVQDTAGVPAARYRTMQILLGVMAAIFVVTPFVLLFIVRDWRVLGTLAAGAALVWPFWRINQNNAPRAYDPRNPPDELME